MDNITYNTRDCEDLIITNFVKCRHLNNESTIHKTIIWLVSNKFKLSEWVLENIDKEIHTYTFFSNNCVIIQEKNGLLKITYSYFKIEVEHIGSFEWANDWITRFDSNFKRAVCLIKWKYSVDGYEIDVPLNFNKINKSAYPWIKQDLCDYFNEYLNSNACILILIGQPGTGKTTFIKNLISYSGKNATVTYDEKVMMQDDLFANFIINDSNFLILEDADIFLKPRTDGNNVMQKFLNVSDGLVSTLNKKIIFSTNIPSIKGIDNALIRPGRCFDVIKFRPLTVDEAKKVIAENGSGKLPKDKNNITLAEIFSTQQCTDIFNQKGPGFY